MTDHEWMDEVGAYLLQALPPRDEAAFEAHMETCAQCRDEVAYLRLAADALPNSPIQLTPPAELKGRVMAIVNSEAQLLKAAGARADEPEGQPGPRKKRVLAVLRPGWWSVRPGLALAGTVLVLALGAGGALLGESALRTPTTERQFTAQVGQAKLIVRKSGHSTLVATHLPQPRTGHVYQVWLKHDGEKDARPTNALFSSRGDGTASVDVPGSLKHVDEVLVTSEPEGGSPRPTSPPVIVARPA